METLKILMIAFMMLVTFSLISCNEHSDDPIGKCKPMVWKAEVAVQATDGVYSVSATGGEFTFSCQNYSYPWMDDAVSNGEYFFPPYDGNDFHTITADWFKAEIDGNLLNVVFNANDTKEERPLQLTVTAGDIFYTFRFKQFAN